MPELTLHIERCAERGAAGLEPAGTDPEGAGMTYVRTTDHGPIGVDLLRDLIARVVIHDAVADQVCELLYAHLGAGADADPAVAAVGVRELLTGTLAAATPEDWQAISDQLIANARAALEAHRPVAERAQEQADSWRTMRVSQTFVLTDEKWQAFNEMLDRPPRVIPAVVNLFRRERPR
jgi:uncharacterized protein (DUF1778 family)